MNVALGFLRKKQNILLCSLFLLTIFMVLFFDLQDTMVNDIQVDMDNTTCKLSINLGRKIFFHVCTKDSSYVYDIRYFFKDNQNKVKPYIAGVQLLEREFRKLCLQCN